MSFSRAHFSVHVLLVTLACACSPSLEPIEVAPGCPERPLRGPEQYASASPELLIADFEPDAASADGGAQSVDCSDKLYKAGGRDGSWVRGRDLTSQSVTMLPATACAARGKCGGHFATSTPTSWGNNWTAFFRSGNGPYDASAYSGISFWAAFGGDNGPGFPVPFGIVTTDTAPNSSLCGNSCGDDYLKGIKLTHDWQRYVLRFDDPGLAQQGWGAVQRPLRRDQLVGFIVWTKQSCDIWIDDIRFEP